MNHLSLKLVENQRLLERGFSIFHHEKAPNIQVAGRH
jgi:hypothetical protein